MEERLHAMYEGVLRRGTFVTWEREVAEYGAVSNTWTRYCVHLCAGPKCLHPAFTAPRHPLLLVAGDSNGEEEGLY